MKNKAFIFFGIFALLMAGIFAFSNNDFEKAFKQERLVTITDAHGELMAAPSQAFYQYTWTMDTITNAANDTLNLPSALRPLLSDFEQCWSIVRTNISGTTNLAVKIEQTPYLYSGSTAPTLGWVTALNSANASAATAATTATTENIVLSMSPACNYRCIVDGTGTQSTSYRLRLVLKRKT
jgi:hypothetical protein